MRSTPSWRVSVIVPLLATAVLTASDGRPAAAQAAASEAPCPKTNLPGDVEILSGVAAKTRIDALYRRNEQARQQHEENLRAARTHGATVTGNESYVVVDYKRKPASAVARIFNTLFPTLHAQAFSLGDATLYYSAGEDWAEVTIDGVDGTISGVFGIIWGPWPGYPNLSWYTKPWVGRWAICALVGCGGGCAFNLAGCGAICGQGFVTCGAYNYLNYRYCRSRGKSESEC